MSAYVRYFYLYNIAIFKRLAKEQVSEDLDFYTPQFRTRIIL